MKVSKRLKKVSDHDGRVTLFRNNLSGKDWYTGFRGRHPENKDQKKYNNTEMKTKQSTRWENYIQLA